MTDDKYIPGVCNIGPQEIKKRRQAGIIGLIGIVVMLAVLMIFNLPAYFRLLVFIPAFMAATGFLQAYFHFCPAYGFKGVFNVVRSVGQTDTVEQAMFRKKDRQKALQILIYSIIIGILVAGTTYVLPDKDLEIYKITPMW